MIETSKLHLHILAAVALALAACNPDAAGQIPCVEDVSCPNDYPVCGPNGKCIAGTSTAAASVAVIGADGHAASDYVSATVRMLVSARAATGVKTVTLAAGSTTFAASATPATPPVYAFDVDTTRLPDGDATLTATVTAGNGSTGSANGTLHVDNAVPVITSFTVAGAASTTITSGKTAALSAAFSGGTAVVTATPGGASISLSSGASALVSPDVQTTYRLVVTSRSGVTASSGAGAHPDVGVFVVGPTTFTGSANVSPGAIQQGPGSGSFTFTAPSFGPTVVAADVKDGSGAVVGTIATSGGNVLVPIPDTAPGTTQLSYTLVLRNGATVPDTVAFPLIVGVGSPPIISAFSGSATITAGTSAALQATFSGGNGVITPGNIPILSGGTALVAPATTTTYRLTVTNPTTGLAAATGTSPPDVTVTVVAAPSVSAFTASAGHVTSADALTFSISTTGVSGNASVAASCSPAATVSGFSIALTGGAGTSAPQAAPAVTVSTNCTYTATVQNAAGTQDVGRAVVTVEPPPTISSFQFQSTGTLSAVFAVHGDVVLAHTYDAHGGTATINGVPAGTTTTTFTDLRIDTDYVLTVTNLAGKTATSATASASVAPGNWASLNTNTFHVRQGATVTALDNGKVLIAGGTDLTGTPVNTADVCDATGACNATANGMSDARAYHTATKVPQTAANNGGKVLLAGGFKDAGPATAVTSADFYDPATNSFAATNAITTATVTSARARHVAVLLGSTGVILIAGGTSDDGTTILNTALEYGAGAASPTRTDVSNTMALARMDFTGTVLIGGNVLVVGGRMGSTTADRTAELFDPTAGGGTGAFSTTGALPAGEDKRAHTAVLISGASTNAGKVLISGGATGTGTPSVTQFLYSSGAFTQISSLATPRSNHAAISLPTDSILICGGTSTGTNTLSSCERYDPASGLGTMFPTAAMLEARKDFGLAPITISSSVEILAAGSPSTPMNYAETYDTN